MIAEIATHKKLARALRPGRASSLLFVLGSVVAADVDRTVGAPLPAAVVGEERPVVVVVTMAENAVAKMTMADSVMTVAAAMSAVAAAGESLTGNGQGSGGQRESCDRRGNDGLEFRHGRLLDWAGQGSPWDDPSLAAQGCDRM